MQPLILAVDDEEMILSVLEVTLGNRYSILKARSAKEALDLLEQHVVHLVICDVMMPVMDGFALCREIKSNVDYALIPVILLTAKNTMEAKVTGLELGADAYIEKPFLEDFLLAQIANLLDNRNKVAEYFARKSPVAEANVDEPSEEERFMKQLDRTIQENMQNPLLDVRKLAEMMTMSRISLYRKVRAYSQLSPAELITIARLKKAADLMAGGAYRIYEIADLVGFSSPGSLTRNFLRQFNMTPTAYFRAQHRSSGDR
jgi:two-component system cell cycle response regulator